MTPAETVVHAFGGFNEVAKIVGTRRHTVYRWLWPKEKGGTAGRVPQRYFHRLLAKAEMLGLQLTVEHLITGRPGTKFTGKRQYSKSQ